MLQLNGRTTFSRTRNNRRLIKHRRHDIGGDSGVQDGDMSPTDGIYTHVISVIHLLPDHLSKHRIAESRARKNDYYCISKIWPL